MPFGCFCAACYGAVLHPDGQAMVPGDPGDPWREFNAVWEATKADQQMPVCIENAIQANERDRYRRRWRDSQIEVDDPMSLIILSIPEAPTHALHVLDSLNGEDITRFVFAFLRDGEFYGHETGRPVLEREGDAVLQTWPLTMKEPSYADD